MKTLFYIIAACLLAAPGHTGDFAATVKTVTDGDTIVVADSDGKTHKIRLFGIDAPEGDQEGGDGAAAALTALIHRENVVVTPVDTDKYKRTVALVFWEGYCINGQMVAEGWAWVYPMFCKQPMCDDWKQLQEEARENRRGIWAGEDPMPPWEYRKSKRKGK